MSVQSWFSAAAIASAVLFGWQPQQSARASTIDVVFIPPAVEPQDLCHADASLDPALADTALADGLADSGALTDEMRLQFIRQDINRLQTSDPDRWFDFLLTLIGWQGELDPDFAGTDGLLARINLYIDAGRLDLLQSEDLIATLRQSVAEMSNAQKMALAQLYLTASASPRTWR